MKKRCEYFVYLMVCAMLLALLLSQPIKAKEKRVVKVAYPIQKNLTEIDDNGQYAGYTTDYLYKIAELAGWELSFVTYPDLSEDEQLMQAIEDVKTGKADVLGSMLFSDELVESYAYPKNSYGMVYTTLETSDHNYNLNEMNYQECNPLRVAILDKAQTRRKEIEKFAKNTGLEINYVKCNSQEEQVEAVNSGKADALINVTMNFIPNMKVLDKFAGRPFYCISGINNKELIEEMDTALEKIERIDPDFSTRVQKRHFSDKLMEFSLTEEEKEYVSDHRNVRVLVCPRHAPFSFLNADNELCGIAISILNRISESSGLQFEYVLRDEEKDFSEEIASGNYDLIVGPPKNGEYALANNCVTSQRYLDASVTMFKNKDAQNKTKSEMILAMDSEFPYEKAEDYKGVLYFNDSESCIEAVEDGTADVSYANRYTLDYYVSINVYHNLSTINLADYSSPTSFYFPREVNEHLLSIVNKYIRSMPSKEVQSYLATALSQKDNMSVSHFVRENVWLVSAIVVIIILLIVLVLFLLINNHRNRDRNLRLEKAMNAKSDFLSRMSHDLRTPMNGIIGLTDLMKEQKNLPDNVKHDIDSIDESANYLLSLINDTLDMRKIESEEIELHLETVNVQKLVENILGTVEPLVNEKNIQLEVIPINAELEYIRVDRIRLQQIFINIISNSIKFTPEGGKIHMEIECLKRENGIAYDRISIEDTGIGISKEFLPHIFDTFSQENTSTTSNYNGTGLGMSIVKNWLN